MTLARQWEGQTPFQETWFVEVLFGPDRGLWVRYVLDASRRIAQVWCLVLGREGVLHQELQEVALGGVGGHPFACPQGSLTRDRITGQLGEVSWSLQLEDQGVRHRHVPRLLTLLGLGRTYHPAMLDLRVQGTLTFGDTTWTVERGMGVLGHLWGRRSRIDRWAWAHCNAFHEDGIVFEGLSAGLGRLPLTSLVLHAQGHHYGFSGVRQVMRAWSDVRAPSWTFESRRGSTQLTGRVVLDPSTAVTVRYDRAGQAPLYCTNTRFADLEVYLRDPARGVDLALRSREAAFEIVGPTALGAPLLP